MATFTGYQFDKVRVTPEADALMYHQLAGRRSHFIEGVGDELNITPSASGCIIGTGAAVILGRLVRVTEATPVAIPSGQSGYIVAVVDLSQKNSSEGDPATSNYVVTNNQLSFEFATTNTGQDIFNGGSRGVVEIATVTDMGGTWKITPNGPFFQTGNPWTPDIIQELVDYVPRVSESGSGNDIDKIVNFVNGWSQYGKASSYYVHGNVCHVTLFMYHTGTISNISVTPVTFKTDYKPILPAVVTGTLVDSSVKNNWACYGSVDIDNNKLAMLVLPSGAQSNSYMNVAFDYLIER